MNQIAKASKVPVSTKVYTTLIIGAGISGMCMAINLKKAGITDFIILEKADRLGGTWRDNTYPGCGCDVMSHFYSYSFEPNPNWSRKYSRQPEILDYLEHCARKYGLDPFIQFKTTVTTATFDAREGLWLVQAEGGTTFRGRTLVAGCGQLNRPMLPDIRGVETFQGTSFHSARWNHDHDLSGETVAVIGNGASAVQFVPEIAPVVKNMAVFQRTPNWIIPKMDRSFSESEKRRFRNSPLWHRLYRTWIYWRWEYDFPSFRTDSRAARRKKDLVTGLIKNVVTKPGLYPVLQPDYHIGCKRILPSDNFYQALQRGNVEVVTSPIDKITTDGVVTKDGEKHQADTIIYATGFETQSFLGPIDIKGVAARSLQETWHGSAEAYLGITVSGFPNFFMLYGPNTNLGHHSIIFMIECQAQYTLKCIKTLIRRDLKSMDVKQDAMTRFNARLQNDLKKTAWSSACRSWYKNAEGKVTNNWSGFISQYWLRTRRPRLSDYKLQGRGEGGGADAVTSATSEGRTMASTR